MINIIRNASPVIIMIVLIMILCFVTQSCHGQFDFDKEVAGLFDFGKIPEEFSQQPKLINISSVTTATPSAVIITAFSTTISMDDDVFDEKIDNDLDYKHKQQLPEFGEIQQNLDDRVANVSENAIKKRSFGGGHSSGGYSASFEGGHSSGGYGGGHGGYGGGHGGYGGRKCLHFQFLF